MTSKYDWEIYTDKKEEYRWRAIASNGEKVAASCEGYSSKSSCVSNAERHGMTGEFKGGEKDTWEFYEDKGGKFRWRRTAVNGNIVGAACQGYKAKVSAKNNAKNLGWIN